MRLGELDDGKGKREKAAATHYAAFIKLWERPIRTAAKGGGGSQPTRATQGYGATVVLPTNLWST